MLLFMKIEVQFDTNMLTDASESVFLSYDPEMSVYVYVTSRCPLTSAWEVEGPLLPVSLKIDFDRQAFFFLSHINFYAQRRKLKQTYKVLIFT